MTTAYLHGVRVIEQTAGVRPLRTIPTAVVGIVGTAPGAATQAAATLSTGSADADNALTFSAINPGSGGNAITVHLRDPQANLADLAVSVSGSAITVNLETDAAGAVTSLASEVLAAIEASAAASALVSVADTGASDGSGVVVPSIKPAALAGGRDEAFPLNTPVLIPGDRLQAADLGTTGTLPPALDAIFDQAAPYIVVVRVAEGIDTAATRTNIIGGTVSGQHTGLKALLDAESNLGIRPRILGIPGHDTAEVTAELLGVADTLRAFVYASCDGAADSAAAIAHRAKFGSRRLMLIWPEFTGWNSATSTTDTLLAVSRALGLRAKIDLEQGWHKTLSNVPVNGVTGISKSVSWALQDESTTANLLNANEVTTLIQRDGLRFWGSRTASIEPLYAFESAVRTGDVLADTIAEGLFAFIDRPLNATLMNDILETVKAKGRWLVAQGYLVGFDAWISADRNTAETLADGQLHLDYEFTPVPPLEQLNLYQTITASYLASLVSA